jgi:imidazole glycerol-phosphate synthase subunit HisH
MRVGIVKVIDYGRGNLFSIESALRHIGLEAKFVTSPDEILAPGPTILPGVGAFSDAMDALKSREIVEAVRAFSRSGDPLLGICLGMQVFATKGEEFGIHDGLDIIKGRVLRLPEGDQTPGSIRVPNVGWRQVTIVNSASNLTTALDAGHFYFVHSYYLSAEDTGDIVATLPINGTEVATVVCRENVVGCQFHPERSGVCGLKLLQAMFVA